MSATELLRALKRAVPAREAGLIALSLSLAGCNVGQPGTMSRATPPPQTETKGAQELVAPSKAPEAPPKPAPPAPPPVQRVSTPAPPPAIVSKSAEKAAAPTPPAPARISQKSTRLPEPSVSKAPPTADTSGAVTSAPVEALILRGPPPQPRSSLRAGVKALLWLGFGLGAAALAVLTRLYLIRRAALTAGPGPSSEELRMPRELGIKEPLDLPQEPALAEEP